MENYQSEPSVTTTSVGVRYGIILGIISIVYFLVLTIAGIVANQGVWQYVGMLPLVALIFLAHKYYKEHNGGLMAYSQGLGIGTLVGLVSSAISCVFTYIYIKFIDASFLEAIKEKSYEDLQSRGLSDEQIEASMSVMEKMTSAEAIVIMGVIGGVFFGFLIALIVSIFTQKTNPNAGI
jgi:hypothetical protein